MIIDTHIHLNDQRYQSILEEVITTAKAADVQKMIVIGYDKASSIKAVEIANQYDGIYAAVGLHPSDVRKETDLELTWLEQLLSNEKVIAIGEIGLDYYWDKEFKSLQQEMFIKQIEIAKRHDLPICVHSRDAINDTYEILKHHLVKGVVHCFSGSLEMAKKFVECGYYLGIGGVLTFSNNRVTKEVVTNIDIKYLLTETDGPYLTPHPYRGKLNRPEYISYVIDEIATLKGLKKEEVERKIAENVQELFKI